MPENLALKATASATSEHNARYLAKFAIDGKIPVTGTAGAGASALSHSVTLTLTVT